MITKCAYRKFAFIFLLFASRSVSEIPLVELRGLSICMRPEYAQLAPAYGALYWYSPYVRNLYQFGDPKSAIVKLARNLFFVHVDGSFDVTRSATKIARFFEPEDIGKIIGTIYRNRDNLQQIHNDIQQITQQVFNSKKGIIKPILLADTQRSVTRQQDTLRAVETDILQFVPENQRDAWNTLFQELQTTKKLDMKQVNRLIGKIADVSTKNAIKAKLPAVQGLIVRLAKNIPTMEAEQASSDPVNEFLLVDAGITKNKEQSFAQIVVGALQEEQEQIYPPKNSIYLLLAWLWKHSNNRIDAKKYLESLAQTIGILPTQLYHWLEGLYTFSNYELLKNKSVEQIITLPLEDLIFARYGFDLYENMLPPRVSMTGGVEYRSPDGTLLSPPGGYPDCGETSLRNFFNALLYDAKKREFDASILEKMNTHKPLINYYKKHKAVDKINTKEAHNDWSQVVSGLPDVNYEGGTCEINAGIKNMLKVIAGLIPGVSSFDQLAQRLKEQNIEMNIRSQHPLNDERYDKNNTIDITIKNPDTKPFTLSWRFTPGHFEIKFPPPSAMKYQKFQEALSSRIGQTEQLHQWPLITLYAIFNATYEEILSIAPAIDFVPYNALLLLPTKTPENRIEITGKTIIKMIKEKDEKKLNKYQEMILSIHKSLPRDYWHLRNFYSNILSSITPSTVFVQQKLLKEQKDDKGKIAYIEIIITKKIPVDEAGKALLKPFYDWASKNLSIIPGAPRINLINMILDKPIPADEAGKALLKPFCDWASKNLSIIPGRSKIDLIEKILDKKIPADEAGKALLKPFCDWASKNLSIIPGERQKVNLIKKILDKPIPEDETGRTWLKPFCDWASNSLSTITDERQKVDFIEKILDKKIPADEAGRTWLKPFYDWASNNLSTVTERQKVHLINMILEKIISVNEAGRTLLKPFYDWANNNLSTVTERQKVNLIYNILNKTISADEAGRTLLKTSYDWASNSLSTITDENDKVNLINMILEKIIIPADESGKTLLKPFYDWTSNNLSTVTERQKVHLINMILEKIIIPADETGRTLLKPFYDWANNNLSTVTERQKVNLIYMILDKTISADEAGRALLKTFYDWASNSLSTIMDEDDKVNLINMILEKIIIPADEAGRTLLKPFYDWTSNNLSTITYENDKVNLINMILEKIIIPADEAGRTLLKPFYDWANNNLSTITGWNKINLINNILAKTISADEARRASLKTFYDWLLNELPNLSTTNKKHIIKELLFIEQSPAKDILTPEQWKKVHAMAKE